MCKLDICFIAVSDCSRTSRLLLFCSCRWGQDLGTSVIPLVSSRCAYILFDPPLAQWKKHLTTMQILQFIIDIFLFNFGCESDTAAYIIVQSRTDLAHPYPMQYTNILRSHTGRTCRTSATALVTRILPFLAVFLSQASWDSLLIFMYKRMQKPTGTGSRKTRTAFKRIILSQDERYVVVSHRDVLASV